MGAMCSGGDIDNKFFSKGYVPPIGEEEEEEIFDIDQLVTLVVNESQGETPGKTPGNEENTTPGGEE
jgi:hypothetical protein